MQILGGGVDDLDHWRSWLGWGFGVFAEDDEDIGDVVLLKADLCGQEMRDAKASDWVSLYRHLSSLVLVGIICRIMI